MMLNLHFYQKYRRPSAIAAMLAMVAFGSGFALDIHAREASHPSALTLQVLDNQTIAEEFVDAMASDDMERARKFLHPILQEELTVEALQQNWQELLAVTGEFQQRLSSSIIENPSTSETLVLVSIQFENLTDDMLVIFDSEGKTIGFDFPQVE